MAGAFSVYQSLKHRSLVKDPLFEIEEYRSAAECDLLIEGNKPRIVATVRGIVHIRGASADVTLTPGEFCLIPAEVVGGSLIAEEDSAFLMATAG